MNWFKEQADKAKKASDKIKKKATQKKPKAFAGPGYSLSDSTSTEGKASSQARRDQQLRAAEERGKAWDKKVAQGRVNRQPVEKFVAPPPPPTMAEVDGPPGLTFEESKAEEAATIERSGFNP